MNRVFLLAATFLIACSDEDSPTPTGPVAEEERELPPPCGVGQEVRPGESCLVGDADLFEVMEDGTGCFRVFREDGESLRCRGDEVDEDGFKASRVDDTDRWRIEELP